MLWKKIALITFNVILAIYLVLAMSAFNKPDTEVRCSGVDITIEKSDRPGFLTCDEVKQPAAVRYAFKDWVVGDLMHDGLPVSSFRTDNW